MRIDHINRKRAGSAYRFCVTFGDGNTVDVSANDLHSYKRFQRAVLSQTGQLYERDSITMARARDRPDLWGRAIRDLLYASTSSEDTTP